MSNWQLSTRFLMLNHEARAILDYIKNAINEEYGFYRNIPRINYGPCGVFAYIFYKKWNALFTEKVDSGK